MTGKAVQQTQADCWLAGGERRNAGAVHNIPMAALMGRMPVFCRMHGKDGSGAVNADGYVLGGRARTGLMGSFTCGRA